MKKVLLIGLLFLGCLTLTGCFGRGNNDKSLLGGLGWFDIKDGPGMERDDDIPEGGGERITVVTKMCEEEGGVVEQWLEGGDTQDVCYFDDKTFCYLEDFAVGNCKKGDMSYIDDGYTFAEQACIDSNGQISQTDEGVDICIISDEEFCYMDDVANGGCDLLKYNVQDIYDIHEDERVYQEYIEECYSQPQITVCGQDGNAYYNKCFMEKAGVEEETELAEVVNGECIYG